MPGEGLTGQFFVGRGDAKAILRGPKPGWGVLLAALAEATNEEDLEIALRD